MSIALAAQAFRARMGSHVRKLILIKLVDCCRDDGSKIFPAVASIAEAAECSRRSVQRVLADFQKVGLLTLVREGGRHGPGLCSTNEYALDVARLDDMVRDGWPRGFGSTDADDAPAEAEPRGDAMSPVEGRHHVAHDRERGDIDDAEGRHNAVTPTIRGTIKVEREARADVEAREDLEQLLALWPNASTVNPRRLDAVWLPMSRAEQRTALAKAPEFLEDNNSQKRTLIPALTTYLGDRMWLHLDRVKAAKAKSQPSAASSARFAPFSKPWFAALLWRIKRGASVADMRKHLNLATTARIGFLPPDDAARDEIAAVAERLQPVFHASPNGAAWRVWLRERGLDLDGDPKAPPMFLPSEWPPPEDDEQDGL